MKKKTRVLTPLPGFASREAASFVAQMDDQSRRLREDTRGATARGLAWQAAPGMNTIGMLLAHIAVVEVFWISALAGVPFECERVIGIDKDDDGMPLPARARPPRGLAGKPLSFFDRMLARARAETKRLVRPLPAAALAGRVQQVLRSGTWTLTRRWILYHVLEHQAGHYGQINLLRHQHRGRRSRT